MSDEINKAREQEIEDIKAVMRLEAGRRFMYRLLVRAGVYETSYIPGAAESNTFFREGKRNIGLWTMTELEESAPGSFLKMMEEAQNAN